MHVVLCIPCYYGLLHAAIVLYTTIQHSLIFVQRCTYYTVGITVTRATVDSNAVISTNALDEYSYVNARDHSITSGVQIARCVTGLGPGVAEDNSALGGLYFNKTRIPFGPCGASASIIQSRAAGLNHMLGLINIIQCTEFTTPVEGIYTCVMINSSMINETFRFGVYFTGRSKSFDLYVHISTYV